MLITYGRKRSSNITVVASGFIAAIEGSPFENGVATLPPDFSGTLRFIIGESDVRVIRSTAAIEELVLEDNAIAMKAYSDDPAVIEITVPWEPQKVTYEDAELIRGAEPGWEYVNGTLILRLPPSEGSTIRIYRVSPTIVSRGEPTKINAFKVLSTLGIIFGITLIVFVLRTLLCMPPKFLAIIIGFGAACIFIVLFGGWQLGTLAALLGIPLILFLSWFFLRRTCPIP